MTKSYMFVDGAYLDVCVREFRRRWFGDRPYELDYLAMGGGCQKVFYYDAMPPKKTDESEGDFKLRELVKSSFFDKLRALKGWHVHLGISKRHRGGVAQQKEVDVLLAVDMLTHTHRKNMDSVIFVGGDQDFRPLLDAVVRDGMYVTLYYQKGSTSDDLINMADARQELDYYTFHQMFSAEAKDAFPAPKKASHHGNFIPVGAVAEEAFRVGVKVASLWHDSGSASDSIVGAAETPGWTVSYTLKGNREMLKNVFGSYHQDLEWRPFVLRRS